MPAAFLMAALLLPIGPALADTNKCPTDKAALTSNLVGADTTTDGNDVTYYFSSFFDRGPSDGVPGLIEYCVYSDSAPTSVVTVAVGDNGGAWGDPPGFNNFSFSRPDGNPSNIPLDGTEDIEMGTATWDDGVPSGFDQIVLHINDAAECNRLYGNDPGTCFVTPGDGTVSESTISTEIHSGATDPTEPDPPTVIADGSSIETGSDVHDSALLEVTPDTVLPGFAGDDIDPGDSYVTFYFYDDSEDPEGVTCDASDEGDPGTYAYSEQVEVSGETVGVNLDGLLLDPHLAQGPLDAGRYAYRAYFTSGDTDVVDSASSGCEPFEVANEAAAISAISTEIHAGEADGGVDPEVIPVADPLTQIALGSTVHDSALLTTDPELTELPTGSTVTFYFYGDGTCDDSAPGEPGEYLEASDPIEVGGQSTEDPGYALDDALAQGPLEAGQYSYQAFFASGDTDVALDAISDCEPFEVLKGDTQTTTEVHDADHNDVTDGEVEAGSTVHDAAYVDFVLDDEVTDPPFAIGGTVTFFFFTNSECTGDPGETSDPVDVVDGVAEDGLPQTITTPGFYAYRADYNGDDNYNDSEGACEPFRVVQRGKTMGFWGNTNGQAVLAANDAFSSANAVTLGINPGNLTRCWVKVDSASKSLTILPNTLNGASLISQCDSTSKRDSGINAGSFNVLLSQTLAISYNIKYITTPGAYAGQTIGLLGCSAVAPLTSSFNGSAGLSATSTVEEVRDYANKLIGHAIKNNGSLTVSQGQIGAMNTLLGCLNAEA